MAEENMSHSKAECNWAVVKTVVGTVVASAVVARVMRSDIAAFVVVPVATSDSAAVSVVEEMSVADTVADTAAGIVVRIVSGIPAGTVADIADRILPIPDFQVDDGLRLPGTLLQAGP